MAAKHDRVFVVGVGMTKFEKPGRREDFDYPQMVKESVSGAFKDCGLTYTDIQQAVCAYVYGDSTCGQRALYEFGLTGIPIYNVNNNCATGSTALHMAKQLIEGGQSDCVLAVGFEKMERGSLGSKYEDRTNPLDKHIETMSELHDIEPAPMAAQIFGNAGREHMAKYGTTKEHMVKIAYKNHKHSVHNERSQFRKEYSMEEIANCTEVYDPLTKLQCCPTSDGSAAAVLCSEAFLQRHSELASRAVEIVAMEMATDTENLFDGRSMMKIAGQDMTKKAAELVYKKSGLGPKDIQVVELHDCFSCNELITYEALKLCPVGKAGEMVDRGDNTYGGKYVVNPSGGLISKGHPLGATGLAQCFELCSQLRGECGRRQVTGATTALQHNLGLGGACVVGLYRMYNPRKENTKNSKNNKMQLESSFQSDAVFKEIEKRLETEREALMKQFKGAFCFELKKGNDTGYFYFDLKNKGCVYRGKTDKVKPDCTLKMTDEDCFKLMCGKLNPQAAFLQKKVRLSGNMGLAMKLQKLQIKSLNSKM